MYWKFVFKFISDIKKITKTKPKTNTNRLFHSFLVVEDVDFLVVMSIVLAIVILIRLKSGEELEFTRYIFLRLVYPFIFLSLSHTDTDTNT